jgi:hypothetical protein
VYLIDLSIVVPVFNSGPLIRKLVGRVMSFLNGSGRSGELILIDDGSNPETWAAVVAAADRDSRIIGIRLDRNYGQHTALMCGLRVSSGSWVATIDDDLENPPEEIAKLLDAGENGSDLIFGLFHRENRSRARKLGSLFINTINRVAFRKSLGVSVSNFRLIRRDVVDAVCRYGLAKPYITGLALHHARRVTNVEVRHGENRTRKSRYTLPRLLVLTWNVLSLAVRGRLGLLDGTANEEVVPYRILEITGNSEQTARWAEPADWQPTANSQPSSKEPGAFGVYRRLFSRKTESGLDATLILLITLVGFFVGAHQIRQFEGEPILRQSAYAPAVLFACGRGSADVEQHIPALDKFLSVQSDTFSCQLLPANIKLKPLDQYQNYYLYLMHLVGAVWMLTGVSWSALWPLYGLFFAATLCALYGLMRQAMGPAFALASLVPIGLSSLWLSVFPHLYYFIKAPFLLAALMILFGLAVKPPQGRRLLLRAALLGAIVGVSLGFRRDLLAIIPLCLFILMFCSLGNVWRNLLKAVPTVAAFIVAFLATGWPILDTLSQGHNSGHLAILGLSASVTSNLGIIPSFYDWGAFPPDVDIDVLTDAYHSIVYGTHEQLALRSNAYDKASMGYYLNVALNFPADFLLRPIAAAWNAINGYGLSRGIIIVGPLLFFAFLGLLAMQSLRAAILCCVIVLYVSGYPAILFRYLDYFYLLCFPVFIAGFVIQSGLEGVGRFVPSFRLDPAGIFADRDKPILAWPYAFRAVGFPLAALMLVISLVATSRIVQSAKLETVLESYWSAPTRRVPYRVSNAESGFVSIAINPFLCNGSVCSRDETNEDPRSRFAYLVATFDRETCGRQSLRLLFDYQLDDSGQIPSTTVPVRFGEALRAKVFFRTFAKPGTVLKRIKLRAEEAACLTGIGAVRWDRMPPVFLSMVMTDRWKIQRRHMVLSEELTMFRSVADRKLPN